ncbi:MAG: RNA methyltransferase [Lewinellaceae bacterium]|nr:RNA methyltransferase [Lewinellaceae bacterium]
MSLQQKKYRQKYRKFIVEGEKLVGELLLQKTFQTEALFGTERWADANVALAPYFLQKFNAVTEPELKKISALTTPNQVLALVQMPDTEPIPVFPRTGFHFFLDGLRDPGNLGAVLRVADWFGMSWVCCAPDTADLYNPKTVQASMGAVLRVKSLECSLPELLAANPNMPVLGAVMDGENLFQTLLPANGIVVIGNEGAGIRPEVAQLLTRHITIPRAPDGHAESLNAAVAAGIIAAWVYAASSS